MLKSIFFLLLLANGALLAYGQGYFDGFFPAAHEPVRLQSQFNTDKIRLLSAPGAAESKPESVALQAQPIASAAAPPAAAPSMLECIEIASFGPDNAVRFKAALEAAGLGERLTQRKLNGPVSHVVHIPAQGNKEATDKKLAELRALGINDFYVMQEAGPLRGSISLGVFKSNEAARTHLAELSNRGVRSARISERVSDIELVAFQLRGVDTTARNTVDSLRSSFPKLEERDCPPA